MDGEDVSEEIRSQKVTAAVSAVAAHQGVRELMVEKQRILVTRSGVVMDGRDIGTHVLPNAELKIFMTASVEERAIRRHLENEKRGIVSSLEQLKTEISERDRADSEREVSPLRQAEDAVLIDTTSMSIEEVAEKISHLAEKRISRMNLYPLGKALVSILFYPLYQNKSNWKGKFSERRRSSTLYESY